MRYLIDFWAFLSILVVFGGALLGALGWFLHRRTKLRVQKERLLAGFHDQLEKSPAVLRAVDFIRGATAKKKLEQLLSPQLELISATETAIKQDMDEFFRILNSISEAVHRTKILSREETEVFSWYFRLLQHHPVLSHYFYESGFLDLWDFAQSFLEKDEVEI